MLRLRRHGAGLYHELRHQVRDWAVGVAMNARKRHFIPKKNKAEANKRNRAMLKRFAEYRPECLFVTDAAGQFCRIPTVASHTIPNAKVLDPMKGRDDRGRDGRVLEMIWGEAAFSHLFISSSEEHPMDLTVEGFKPISRGIGDASTGKFACKCHEIQTFGPIDVSEPDFTDPEVLFLCEYRAYLYAYSHLLRAKWMVSQWNREIMRDRNVTRRIQWLRRSKQIDNLLPQTEAVVSRLGGLWYGKPGSANITPQVVSGEVIYFRSSLKYAACLPLQYFLPETIGTEWA